MQTKTNTRPRAAALLLAAAALPCIPAFAQTTTPDAAPPVTATVPAATPPEATPAPVATAPAAAPAPVFAAPSPVVQATPPRPAPVAEAPAETVADAAPARHAAPVRVAKPVAAKRSDGVAPVAAVAAPPAVTPAPQAAPETPPPASQSPFAEPTPVADAPPVIDRQTTVASERPVWPFVVGALALLGVVLAALSYGRRRRAIAKYDNYYADEDAPVAAAVAATATVPVADPVPVMTAPVEQPAAAYTLQNDERPWIGLTLLPLRVGSQGDDMVVQYELTVENAGTVPAEGVRVSSFLIDDRETSDSALGRIAALGEVQSHVIDVAPGGSVPLTTTITVDRSQIVDGQFLPKVVADAIYPLPGNREGHFAARFAMGIADGDDLSAVDVATENTMHDDVGARLDDVLERA